MPQISSAIPDVNAIPLWSGSIRPVKPANSSAEYESQNPAIELRHGDRVLHADWGIGRVLRSAEASSPDVPVQWADTVRRVRRNEARRILPRTMLARIIESTSPAITAWMVRKADRDGVIRPDATGRFAGHKVHYYDAARVPALIERLSKPDPWPAGMLVLHSEYGAGRITGCTPNSFGNPGTGSENRTVQFFSLEAPASIPVKELRRLVTRQVMANRIGVDRKTFSRHGARHGIQPDHVCHDRGGFYYDENRTEEIRRRWSAPFRNERTRPGSLVIDPYGDVATVEFVDDTGRAHLRSAQDLSSIEVSVSRLRELVSLRELARRENMSRYRLQRLLAAAQVPPVHRHGKTLYFDSINARQAIRIELRREESALNLHVLSQRTGLSQDVLARKIRQGFIRTICRDGIHLVDEEEARRVEAVVTALNSASKGLAALGICRFQPRGRHGQEIVEWDIPRLIGKIRSLAGEEQRLILRQVAWLYEGAGQRRLQTALVAHIESAQASCEDAQLVLMLLDHLPACAEKTFRIRLMLAAYNCADSQSWLKRRANARDTEHGCGRMWAGMERSMTAVLSQSTDVFGCSEHRNAQLNHSSGRDHTLAPGAVILFVGKGTPEPGVILRVEQQCWNALARTWTRTIVVRFCDGERRVNADTAEAGSRYTRAVLPLFSPEQASQLFRVVQPRPAHDAHQAGTQL